MPPVFKIHQYSDYSHVLILVQGAIIFFMKDKKADRIADRVAKGFAELRDQQDLSHEAIAEKTGLHRSTISLIESKKRSPTLRNCIKIANALGYELSDLLKEAEDIDSLK